MVQSIANTTFLAECFWPDVHPDQVQRAAKRLTETEQLLAREGLHVAFIGSMLISADDVIFFLFDAARSEDVQLLCDRAELQYERVVGSIVSAYD